ncbi:hypothetical protein J3E73DRAFT_391961 [Bipolaris maydis]|nr:hypothetical protein J3E73DRAFT_391961 [Bipolaris maydis]
MISWKLVHSLVLAISVCLALAHENLSSMEIRSRVSWTSLTFDEKDAYVNADLCLLAAPSKLGLTGAVSRWDDIQWPHVVQSASVHNVSAFLPFQRYLMTAHEHLIRTECRMYDTDMFDDRYFGGNGTDGTYRVIDGKFANLTLRWLGDGSTKDHYLTRKNDEASLNGTDRENIAKSNAITKYTSAWECWASGSGPHEAGHRGIGGIMQDDALSPANGTGVPSAPGAPQNPTNHLGGTGPEFTNYFGDNGGNVTTLNHNIYMADILPNVTIGQLMDLNGPVICSEYY